ncbi:hypothetical protein [Clostridium sp.]|jgi:hypothetical protein|uniref:hypothetical protein n=1 Tax=Clostridium sp. TaxID=1506 RepID=UPI003EEC7E17
MKSKNIIITVVIMTIISIIFNFANAFTGNFATTINLIVSLFYLLLWIIISVYIYVKKDITFSECMFYYWLISLISSVLSIKISSVIFLPSYIIYYTPFYGFRIFLKTYIPTFSYMMSTISIIFVIVAYYINKVSPLCSSTEAGQSKESHNTRR